MIGPDALQVIREGAECAAKLAAVEHAHISGDFYEMESLLQGVDPIDVRHTANKLLALANILALAEQDRGVPGAGHGSSPDGGLSFLPSRVTSDRDAAVAGQASAPSTYPQVTHVGDNWSRKVPCA